MRRDRLRAVSAKPYKRQASRKVGMGNNREGRKHMKMRIAAAAAALISCGGGAFAQEVKIGVALPYSGVGAELGQLVDRGIETFMKMNPDAFKPYKVTLVKRDYKDPGGATAK